MTPAELSDAVVSAVRAAAEEAQLAVAVPEQATVERPKNPAHGDYATNIAMQLARAAGRPPRDLAELIARHLAKCEAVAAVEVAGPGFLNIRLREDALGGIARRVVVAGPEYGRTDTFHGERVNLEFVSANPTGPVHIGGARWAAVGDALGRLLEFSGAAVTREYYFNDAGAQIDRFAESVYRAARDEAPPENGYGGAYVTEIAATIEARHPGLLARPEREALPEVRRQAVGLMFEEIKSSLVAFGVHFDVYFNEESLHTAGDIEAAVEQLRAVGHVYEADGAVWLRTTDFGDDKDRVLVRSDGTPTYFCADCAYYLNKRRRGFDRCVYMLGADHHGYVGRMRAMAACFGDDADRHIEILIGQLVNLVRDGAPVRMSKRAGTIVTMDDLVEAVGVDAARYALARSSTDSTVDLDLDLLTRQVAENPVFYVQYAHARIASLLRHADELGVTLGEPAQFSPQLLTHEREAALLGELGEFPRVVSTAAELREAHRVARYLERLAGTYHRFYDACRVLPLGDEEPGELHRARLWLCEATRVVLANGLGLLGVTAPERM